MKKQLFTYGLTIFFAGYIVNEVISSKEIIAGLVFLAVLTLIVFLALEMFKKEKIIKLKKELIVANASLLQANSRIEELTWQIEKGTAITKEINKQAKDFLEANTPENMRPIKLYVPQSPAAEKLGSKLRASICESEN